MRMSQAFGGTRREVPSDAHLDSHKLLIRAGFIRPLSTGIYSLLPLGWRSHSKIEGIIREEIDAIGGQELRMPVVHPSRIWQETGRWDEIGPEMTRFTDRNERDMVLAMTHEETVVDLVKGEVNSYRQLPRLIYHIQTKWRDDPRPRGGLIRVREFTMKDSYSLDTSWEGLGEQYDRHYDAYFRIFQRCGLPVMAVESDVGMMGGKVAHEFMYLTPVGEDTIVLCKECGYAANRQLAVFAKPAADAEDPKGIEKVETPGAKTIQGLCEQLGVPASKTAKVLFMTATLPSDDGEDVEKLVLALVRGDMEVNETKLINAVRAKDLRPATAAEIRAVGAEPGFGSPIGLTGVQVVVDDALAETPNVVTGANEAEYHLMNVNLGRDFEVDIVTDIAAAQAGDACADCGSTLETSRGIEVGNIFQLGTRYSEATNCNFVDESGQSHPIIMGSYGIGLERALASIAEAHHDDDGLTWPISVSPYDVHLTTLPKDGPEIVEAGDRIYNTLQSAGLDVLYDDRDESPGVKFTDADLIGIPLRITIGGRALGQGGVEVKRRDADGADIVAEGDVLDRVQAELETLWEAVSV